MLSAGSSAGEDGGAEGSFHRGDGEQDEGNVGCHLRWGVCVEDHRLRQEEARRCSRTGPGHVLAWYRREKFIYFFLDLKSRTSAVNRMPAKIPSCLFCSVLYEQVRLQDVFAHLPERGRNRARHSLVSVLRGDEGTQ